MDDFPLACGVKFTSEVSLSPWEEDEEFVQEIEGEIFGMISESTEGVFGSLSLLKVSHTEAMNRGVGLLQICDAHSEYLESLYHAFFDADEETHEELGIEPISGELLIIREVSLPEHYRDGVIVAAIATAIAFTGPRDLVVTDASLGLTVEECKALGFVKVAGTDFLFRDTNVNNPYRRQRPHE